MSCLCEVTKRRHMWSPDMQGHSSPRSHSHRLTPCKKKCSDDLAQQLMLRIGCMSLERINLLRAVTTSVSLQAGSDADIPAKPKKRHNSARETRACIPWHSLSRRPWMGPKCRGLNKALNPNPKTLNHSWTIMVVYMYPLGIWILWVHRIPIVCIVVPFLGLHYRILVKRLL